MTILPGMSGYDYFTDSGTGWEVAQGIGRAGDGAIHRFGSGFIGGYITGIDSNPGGAISPYFAVDGFQLKAGDSGVWSDAGIAIMAWMIDGTSNLLALVTGTSGDLCLWRYFDNVSGGRTLVATATGALADPDTFYPIECKVIYGTGDCQFILRVSGSVVLTTMLGAGRSWSNSIYHQPILNLNVSSPANYAVFVDDVYSLDNTGSYHNDFIGPAIIDRLNPTGLGVVESTDSANIDDPTPDGATTSIFFPPGNGDRWAMSDLTAGYTPIAVQADWDGVAVHFGGAGLLETQFDTNSTIWTAPTALSFPYPLGSEYFERNLLVELNPITGVPWTAGEINALQAGLLSTGSAGTNGVNITQFLLEVLAIPAVTATQPYWGAVVG